MLIVSHAHRRGLSFHIMAHVSYFGSCTWLFIGLLFVYQALTENIATEARDRELRILYFDR